MVARRTRPGCALREHARTAEPRTRAISGSTPRRARSSRSSTPTIRGSPRRSSARSRTCAAHPEIALVSCHAYACDEQMQRESVVHAAESPSGWMLERLLVHNVVLNPTCVLVRRAALERVGGFSDLRKWEDWDTWLRIAKICAARVHSRRCWRRFAAIVAASPRRTATSTLHSTRRSSSATSMMSSSRWKRRLLRRRARSVSYFHVARLIGDHDRVAARRYSLRALLLDPTVLTRRKIGSVLRTHVPVWPAATRRATGTYERVGIMTAPTSASPGMQPAGSRTFSDTRSCVRRSPVRARTRHGLRCHARARPLAHAGRVRCRRVLARRHVLLRRRHRPRSRGRARVSLGRARRADRVDRVLDRLRRRGRSGRCCCGASRHCSHRSDRVRKRSGCCACSVCSSRCRRWARCTSTAFVRRSTSRSWCAPFAVSTFMKGAVAVVAAAFGAGVWSLVIGQLVGTLSARSGSGASSRGARARCSRERPRRAC